MSTGQQLALALTADQNEHASDLMVPLRGDTEIVGARRQGETRSHILLVTGRSGGGVNVTCPFCHRPPRRFDSITLRELSHMEYEHQRNIEIGLRRRDLLARINDETVVWS